VIWPTKANPVKFLIKAGMQAGLGCSLMPTRDIELLIPDQSRGMKVEIDNRASPQPPRVSKSLCLLRANKQSIVCLVCSPSEIFLQTILHVAAIEVVAGFPEEQEIKAQLDLSQFRGRQQKRKSACPL
jgi:hypothetical protein